MEQFKKLLRDMAEAGLTVACYNWMPSEDWQRTSSTVRERGGALALADRPSDGDVREARDGADVSGLIEGKEEGAEKHEEKERK